MKRVPRPVDGWLAIDKPEGLGSSRVVARLKRLFDARRVGHGGTLDPLATGVLPIAFGAATRTVPFVMEGSKTYRMTVAFGERRSTDDREGDVLEMSDARPTADTIRAALPTLTGAILQVPPAFSALKLQGKRAYALARDGRPPELPPRPARVDRFALLEVLDPDRAVFEIDCGKGVYMRSLARDLARLVGTVGHVASLRRLRCGPFTADAAISLDNPALAVQDAPASPDLLLPIATVLDDIPALALDQEEAVRLSNGRAIAASEFEGRFPGTLANLSEGLVRAMAGERVIGLCRVREGWLRPERILQPL